MERTNVVLNDAEKGQKYYAVHCKCGHVKPNRYVEIVFAVRANNGKEAAEMARRFARVKHNKKNAIINCYQITREKYEDINKTNRKDPYLKCKNIQEQRLIEGFESRICYEPEPVVHKKSKQERKDFVKYKLRKQKQFIEALNVSMAMSF